MSIAGLYNRKENLRNLYGNSKSSLCKKLHCYTPSSCLQMFATRTATPRIEVLINWTWGVARYCTESVMSFLDSFTNTFFSIVDTGMDTVSAITDFVAENPGKTAAIALGAVATGGLALTAAPAIGAAVSAAGFGVAGGTISGAAASSAGLAAIGGGSLAAGGTGMAGGTAIVTAAGAIAGGGTTAAVASVANKRGLGRVSEFLRPSGFGS
jgi:hypothetical protein